MFFLGSEEAETCW